MSPPFPLPTYVYKILPEAPPSPLPDALPLSPLDAKDGFIHLSTAAQVPKTAGRFFSNKCTLWLLKIPLKQIEQHVKWEEGMSDCFAHVYDHGLGKSEVIDLKSFEKGKGEDWDAVMSKEQWLV